MDRNSRKLMLFVGLAVALIVIALKTYDNSQRSQGDNVEAATGSADSSVHLTMGNPSHADKDADNFLMRKPYFALSYNNAKGTPNWVSWCLKREDIGSAPRDQIFYPDTTLPGSFQRTTTTEYTGSGFDRGHMCPHGDRSNTQEASHATFVLTNIIPQAPVCNREAWADLEEYCRELVTKKHDTLYIICGPAGVGGTGEKGKKESLAGGKVVVPARCWKVILAIHDGVGGPEDINRVDRNTRLIAVDMPNDQSVGSDWAKFRTSAKAIEKMTGYHFFDRVPAAVIDPLKDKVDNETIHASRSRHRED